VSPFERGLGTELADVPGITAKNGAKTTKKTSTMHMFFMEFRCHPSI